jgi:hypothetical protein
MNGIDSSTFVSNQAGNHISQLATTTDRERTESDSDWFEIEEPDTQWLVTGLITSDGYAAFCGKPKVGKSCLVRNLAACVVKGRQFLGRMVEVPAGTGKVLFVHLDRKDQTWRVAKQFRELGITKEESKRLRLRTDEHVPAEPEKRTEWLTKEIDDFKPHLVVIDLLWQFLDVPNANEYKEVLKGINDLQDKLKAVGYKGATVVTMHARKAVNPDNPADDILGSTAQRGSFGTTIVLSRNRRKKVYTIISDQTDRDDYIGELEEHVILKNPDGTMSLGQSVVDFEGEEAKERSETDIQRILAFILEHQGCGIEDIRLGLSIAKGRALALIQEASVLIDIQGKGVKSDPLKYFVHVYDETGGIQ